MEPVENRIAHLKVEINKHNYNYYLLDTPIITEYDFDQLLQELIFLEKENR